MSPRLLPSLLREAALIHRCLPLLLPECRTIEQARQELKWLIDEFGSSINLQKACLQRNRHVPLQYILGSQPFGSLDIQCRRHVLIPRWETEEWSLNLANAIKESFVKKDKKNLQIVDLCSGTGCIPLLLINETKKLFKNNSLQVDSIDCSQMAINLTKLNFNLNFNKKSNFKNDYNISFKTHKFNILDEIKVKEFISKNLTNQKINILTCNPPYIPPSEFIKDVRSSVRMYEPKLALLGNLEFYHNLIETWIKFDLIESFVYELGDLSQVTYVQQNVPSNWITGVTYDSNSKPRCVFGYNKTAPTDYSATYKNFLNGLSYTN
ncbi:similar to Saccharomyces cerevisiae YNL063W MTQ1 S-adenosylmethionine-dependent methyltransferase [Maudiozyma saulgeensis]|uniref:Similar to Saccharomyces cerevisiae YNL063W MTQ1 S-adenosylmethionine-dependent methyltransferase n=1 Tax=Maudiozyma saulgeensis TaxID=1789683 RepID=A0A1X7QYW9_9SACH|nr:similar to Saccharomyces cerevisiae YNL063W MTQ1 S-adenosylmethionine-dependent methyltransferase [Kazachstania saulgeensis]